MSGRRGSPVDAAAAAALLPRFDGLPARVRGDLGRLCRIRSFAAGDRVIGEDAQPEIVGVVQSGILRMQKTLVTGRQHIVGLLVPGDSFGRVVDGTLPLDIEAATDATICAFQRRPFEALVARSPELERLLALHLVNELDRARDWMIILANRKVAGRVAGFLLMLSTRLAADPQHVRPTNGTIVVTVPISRIDMAHFLGVREESISRAFHALAGSGAISILSAREFELRDIHALAVASGAGV